MFLNIRSTPKQEISPAILEKLNTDANTTVMKLTLVVAVLGCLSLSCVELFNHYDTNWLKHVLFPVSAIVIASTLPFLLRRFRVNEAIITHTIAIIYLSAISIVLYAYSDVAGLTAWGVILILVIVSMCYYSNGIVLAYSFVGGLVWLILLALLHPTLTTYLDMTDHFGRMCIFIIVFGTALWVNRKLKREVLENQNKVILIQQYTEELEAKNKILKKLDQLKDEFLANTTHELRTPLHGIIGLLEPLTEDERGLTKDQKYDLALAVSSARRLSVLVGDILDFSKLKNQDILLQKKPIDLYILTDIVIKSFTIHARKKGIRLLNSVPPDLPLIEADENRFLQIMYNLIGNAVKFTSVGEVRVEAIFDEQWAHITVSDTGIGIPENKQHLIFKAFEQGDTSISREYGGTGLGLAITKSLVELHGGSLLVNSQEGNGSAFTVTFPRADILQTSEGISEPIQLERLPLPEEFVDDGAENSSVAVDFEHSCRILVVDDEPVNLRIIQSLLIKEGHQVTLGHSGKEGLECLRSGAFDLVLLDVMMPQMSGYDVCRAIRKNYSLAQLPVILVTAKDRPEDMLLGFESGANDYLHKPFDNRELITRVGTLLELKKTADLAVSAELFFLQTQIKPHFLHNALSTIISFVRTNPDLAREMLLELSNYLRESFNFSTRLELMPLSKELKLIRSYLFIEKARYSEQLRVQFDIEENLECSVPHLILQPIVENAVRHGILPKPEGGILRISAKTVDGHAVLCVEDDGVGILPENIPLLLSNSGKNTGIALFNVQKRMQTLYGSSIEIESTPGKGTRVSLKIPLYGGVAHDSSSTGGQREALIG